MGNPTVSPAWKRLQEHQTRMQQTRLVDLFEQDPERFRHFSLRLGPLLLDFSKNFIDQPILDSLLALAQDQQLQDAIHNLWRGQAPLAGMDTVPYLSLRDRAYLPLFVEGHDVSSDVRNALYKMQRICQDIRAWHWRGYNSRPLTDIVTLGVGGAINGAEMMCKALWPFRSPSLDLHFVANADAHAFKEKLRQLQPDTTLFIIASKSFATQETLQNAQIARNWLLSNAGHERAVQRHFIAITANYEAAGQFGIPDTNILPMHSWLPSRYAVWNTAGLPIALAVGMERFEQFLDGANKMDQHFLNALLDANMPVIMGLLGVWYVNFWHLSNHAILPYSEQLEGLPGFLLHGLMEANGKSVDLQGKPLEYASGPVVWGAAGTQNQHTFFQLLYQGSQIVPTDFIVAAIEAWHEPGPSSTFFHFLAQSEALMRGGETPDMLTTEQQLPGNRPSTCLLLEDLSPATLGHVLALYEHVALVQSVIWNINPFSHWGTELGKRRSTLVNNIGEQLITQKRDSSTLGLLEHFQRMRRAHERYQLTPDTLKAGESSYPIF